MKPRFVERKLSVVDNDRGVAVSYGNLHGRPRIDSAPVLSFPAASTLGDDLASLGVLQPGPLSKLSRLGRRLAEVLLPSEIRAPFLRELNALQDDQRLRLWIDDSQTRYARYPWEYLLCPVVDGSDPEFLVVHPRLRMVRLCSALSEDVLARPGARPATSGIEMLIVWSEPKTYEPLDGDRLVALIEEKVRDFGTTLARCRVLRPLNRSAEAGEVASWEGVQRAVRECPPHVVFFLAHGDVCTEGHSDSTGTSPAAGEPVVILETEDDRGHGAVSALQLCHLFALSRQTVCFLFASCVSAWRGDRGVVPSIADSLARHGRIVVGQQFDFPISATWPFWSHVFLRLAAEESIADCVHAARCFLHDTSREVQLFGIPLECRSVPVDESQLPADSRTELRRDLTRLSMLEPASLREFLETTLRYPRSLLVELLELLRSDADADADKSLRRLLQRFEKEDSLLVKLLAGARDRDPVHLQPVWFSRLLEPPRVLTWSGAIGVGPWRTTVRCGGRELLVKDCRVSRLDCETVFTSQDFVAGAEVDWYVEALGDGSPQCLARGRFEVLSAEERASTGFSLREALSCPLGLGRTMRLIELCRRAALHATLIEELESVLSASTSRVERFIAHRAIAATYEQQYLELGSRLRRSRPEGRWADQAARFHATKGYESLVQESAQSNPP